MGLAVDQQLNVFVTGWTNSTLNGVALIGTNSNLFLTKYNTSGIRQWTTLNGAADFFTQGGGVAVDPQGNAYVAGISYQKIYNQGLFMAQPTNILVAKYSPSGVQAWQDLGTYQGGLGQIAGIALDSKSNVYVTGFGDMEKFDEPLFLKSYTSEGKKLWETYDMGMVTATGIAIDANDNIYVSGYAGPNVDGQTAQGDVNAYLAKFTNRGLRVSTYLDGTAGSEGDLLKSTWAQCLAVTPSGAVLLAGVTTSAIDGQNFSAGISGGYFILEHEFK